MGIDPTQLRKNSKPRQHDRQKIIDDLDNEIPPTTVPKQIPGYPRHIHLLRKAGPSRVIIFEGRHEGIPEPALKWLSQHKRRTK